MIRSGSHREKGTEMKVAEKEQVFRVRVFHNAELDEKGRPLGMVRGFDILDEQRLVATLSVIAETAEEADPFAIAEGVYRQMNHVDGTELIAAKPHIRSLSVGDTIEITDPEGHITNLACDDIGWRVF